MPNAGQFAPKVLFQSTGVGGSVFLTASEVTIALPPAELLMLQGDPTLAANDALRAQRVAEALKNPGPIARLMFDGASLAPAVVGVSQRIEKVNYLIGSDPSNWQTNLPTYASVVYQQLYPGIDLRYDSLQGAIKGTYTVGPGVNPVQLRWRYEGVEQVQVDSAGNLVIPLVPAPGKTTESRSLVEQAPVAWQQVGGQQVKVDVSYAVATDGSVSFALGKYDPALALTIDPILTYSTYLGGSTYDEARAIAVDGSQRIYITGYTNSTNFASSGYDTNYNGGVYDAFVTKIQNNVRIFSTYIGGSDTDVGEGIAVDSSGNIHVAGGTSSTNFPTPAGVKTMHPNFDQDAFVIKLRSDGAALLYGSYFGGNSDDVALGLAVYNTTTYVVGRTDGNGFTTKNPQDSSYNGGTDVFLARFDLAQAGAASLLSSTYFGGSSSDIAHDVAANSSGIYIVGGTASSASSFPETTNAYDQSYGGSTDAFIAKFNTAASSLSYASYMGGSGTDEGYGIAVDTSNRAFITGYATSGSGFPTKKADDSSYNGATDAFVVGFNPSSSGASSLLYSTFLGGTGTDYGKGIAVEGDSRVTVNGYTSSSDFRTRSSAPMQSAYNGLIDAFVARFDKWRNDTNPVSILHSVYFGGSEQDYASGVALDPDGRMYITGYTYSRLNFPVFLAEQIGNAGSADAFVSKMFPEYDYPGCRWAHTAGVTTIVTYSWGSGLQTTGPGTWRTDAFEPAINSWNNLNNKIRFASTTGTGQVVFRLNPDPNRPNTAGAAIPACPGGGNTTSYDTWINTAVVTQVNLGLTVHEVGHSQSIGHISSFATAVMGNNETPATSTLQSMDDALVDAIYP